jgi:hypothetical protein
MTLDDPSELGFGTRELMVTMHNDARNYGNWLLYRVADPCFVKVHEPSHSLIVETLHAVFPPNRPLTS